MATCSVKQLRLLEDVASTIEVATREEITEGPDSNTKVIRANPRPQSHNRGDFAVITFAADGKTLNPITPGEREWALFFIFGIADNDQDPEDWDVHVDWLMARFTDPDAWLGDEGDAWRGNIGWNNPSGEFVRRWHRFNAAHTASTTADIDKLLGILLHDA